jgi:hypothetical protein
MPFVDGLNVGDSPVQDYPSRWNAAPGQNLLVIRRNQDRRGSVFFLTPPLKPVPISARAAWPDTQPYSIQCFGIAKGNAAS